MSNIPSTAVDQYDFLQHRREQEEKHWKTKTDNVLSELDSILTVEVNTTELCNRTCVFCPRHDPKVFPNRNLHMTPKGAETIAKELGKLDDLSEKEADELYEIVGLGALKYFLLKVATKKHMLFNPEESIDFNGNTGPFIQYTFA